MAPTRVDASSGPFRGIRIRDDDGFSWGDSACPTSGTRILRVLFSRSR